MGGSVSTKLNLERSARWLQIHITDSPVMCVLRQEMDYIRLVLLEKLIAASPDFRTKNTANHKLCQQRKNLYPYSLSVLLQTNTNKFL